MLSSEESDTESMSPELGSPREVYMVEATEEEETADFDKIMRRHKVKKRKLRRLLTHKTF